MSEKAGRYGKIAAAGALYCLTVNLMFQIIRLPELFPDYGEAGGRIYDFSLVLQLFLTVLAAPALEEAVFRGLVYRGLRRKMCYGAAAFLSAFLFGLYHGNPEQGLYGFFMGLFLAFLYEKCGGLIPAFLFHAGANLMSVLGTWCSRYTGIILTQPPAEWLLFAGGGILFLRLILKLKRTSEEDSGREGDKSDFI